MKIKFFKKVTSLVLTFSMLLNSLSLPLTAIAQEVLPTPEPTPIISEITTPEPTISPTETPTAVRSVSPTPISTLELSPTPTAVPTIQTTSEPTASPVFEVSGQLIATTEKVYLSQDQVVVDSTSTDWLTDQSSGVSTSIKKVELGVKYVFPLESKVTLVFKSLPKDENLRTPIKIAKVKISDLNFPNGMSPYGEFAYDITTGMTDGTFDYELTLPKPINQKAEIAYMEDQSSSPILLNDDNTAQDGLTVKANSIDHFTIFVVVNPTPTGPLCVAAGATTGTGCYSTIQDAINSASNGDTIEIQSDITTSQQVNVNKDITINGNGFTVSPFFSWTSNSNNSVIGIHSSGVTISNLTIDGTLGTNLHGINIYAVTNILLDSLTVANNDRSGVVVNGSIVTVNNITTFGNGWHAINVDQGTGVTTAAELIIDGTSSHNENYHIFIDNVNEDVSVDDTNPKQYDYTAGTSPAVWGLYTLKSSGNPSATLSQYANDAPVGWVNGNLGASKATYYEGDSIPYRMVMSNLNLASHSLIIEWDTLKSGKHAEDYLTSFDRTVTTANPCTGVVGCSTFTTSPIPVDLQVSGAGVSQIAGDFRLYGGNITSISSYGYSVGSIGNESTRITITFTPTVSNPVLAWGGHIATRTDWGQNNSAISISGSPYHMRLIDLDGTGGNQDRSLSADAVVYPATINIIKDAVPNHSQDFSFTSTGTEMGNFSLDDDADATLSNTKTFTITSFVNNNGDTKTITEGTVAGWALTNLVCNDTNGSVNLGTKTATLSIVEGETVTCTFINTLQNGTLRVNKVTIPAESEVFAVTANGTGTITGSATQNVTGGSYVDYTVTTGSYSVTETPKTGWIETSNTCVNVSVPAGGISECTITNTKLGKIIVEKQTQPDGSAQSFEFDPSYGSNFFLSDGQTNDSGFVLLPGNYSVSEILPTGWDQDSVVCSDGSNPSSINLNAGETVTCVFTNSQRGSISGYKYNDLNGDGVNDGDWSPVSGWIIELWKGQTYITTSTDANGFYSFTNLINGVYTLVEQVVSGWTNITSTTLGVTLNAGENDLNNNFVNTRYGKIIVEKQTQPDGSAQSFEFDPSYNNSTNFFLSDGQSNDSGNLYPGTYSVTEITPNGWDLTNVVCSDGSRPNSINISSGETVTCVFTNTQRGHIVIKKDAIPDSSQEFTFNNNFGNSNSSTFGLTDDATTGLPSYDAEVLPGKYSVSEDQIGGWKSYSVVCDNGETNDDIDVAAGETVTCTFTNQKLASITLVKNTIGGDSSFDFDATGSGLSSDIDLTSVAGTASQTFTNLDPDLTFTISENVPEGWILNSAICSGSNTPDSITPDSGEEIVCTFTNSKLPVLTVTKVVINDNGGTKVVSDFPLFVDKTQVVSGISNTFNPDSYVVSETSDSNYTQIISGDCDENGNVSLSYGDNKQCTITNNDIQPKLTITKVVVNNYGGTKVVSDFPLFVDTTEVVSGVKNGFNVGNYVVSETQNSGYSAVISGDCSRDGSVSLSLGDEKECTITNSDLPAKLTVIKNVVGGSKLASEFTMNVLGTDVSDDSFSGNESGTAVTLDAGSYVVSEDYVEGYTVGFSDGCQGDITNGEEKTCVVTNTRNMGEIIIKKIIDEDGNLKTTEDQTPGEGWEMDVDGIAGDVEDPIYGNTDDKGEHKTGKIKTGTYYASETQQTGYDFVSATCSDQSLINNIVLDKDEVVTCTFYNTPNGTIHGYKWNDLDGEGDEDLNEEKLGNWTINLFGWNEEDEDYTDLAKQTVTDSNTGLDYGWYWFTHLFPGTYKVCEVNQNGWQQTYPAGDGCHLVTIPDLNLNNLPEMANFVAESPVYNFGNVEDNPEIVISKSNNKSGGANIGDNVKYTLVVENTGNLDLNDLEIKDAIPGGFSYVSGTSYLDGVLISDPTVAGGLLTWNVGNISKGQSVTLTYELKIGDDVVKGSTYTNFATCSASHSSIESNNLFRIVLDRFESNMVECNVADSSVNIGSSNSYGGSLFSQVLGASIELPATGNPTWLLIIALLGLTTGLVIMYQDRKKKYAKN